MKLRNIVMGLTALLALIPAFSSPALADGATMEMNRSSSLTIRYLESDDGNEGVAGAEFTLYLAAVPEEVTKSFTVSLRYRAVFKKGGKTVCLDPSVTASAIEKLVLSFYSSKKSSKGYQTKTVTDANGTAYVSGLPPGIYLVKETKAAKEHLASAAFLVTVPFTRTRTVGGRKLTEWCYDASAEPKPVPCGDLVISKTVRGDGADKKKQFHFAVRLSSEGSFHFRKSNGKEGRLKSGSVIALKAGQSVVIDTIPQGTVYQVKEKEAGLGGYRTKTSGTSGRISRKKQARAIFINTKSKAKKTPAPTLTPTPTRGGYVPPQRTGSPAPNQTVSVPPVKTGDENPVGDWIFIFVCSLFAVLLLFTAKRQKDLRS